MTPHNTTYTIKEVQGRRALNKFLAFPLKLYKNHPYYVPQLHTFEKSTLSPKKNPAFEFCEAKQWLAYDEQGKVVGRVGGIINHESNKIWKEKRVRFGWLDFIEDIEVARLLLDTVMAWGQSQGLQQIHGPMGFSDMDLEGMLVEGFDEMATQATIYNYPYYPKFLEQLGFKKEEDWIQHEIKVPKQVPERVSRIANLLLQKYNLHILQAKRPNDFKPYVHSMFQTYNKALEHLYGFVPLSNKQIDYYFKAYFSLVNPKYLCFVLDENDEVVGFGLTLLSVSKALQKAKGKLFPFGFIPLLQALRHNDTADLFVQGVMPEYIKKGVIAIVYKHTMQALIDNGVTTAITSHILESNKNSHQMFDAFEARQHIRRRAYCKSI